MARSKKQPPKKLKDKKATQDPAHPPDTEGKKPPPEESTAPQEGSSPEEKEPSTEEEIPKEVQEHLEELRKEEELRKNLYTRFVEEMRAGEDQGLRQHHRKQLKQKRGFIAETIERCGFLSADPKLIEPALQRLRKDFTREELEEAGLLDFIPPCKRFPEGDWKIAEFLIGKDILIPYFDGSKGQVVYLRSHKRGPEGVDLEIYGQDTLTDSLPRVVLTEGEFKAAALQQCDIPAIAIPGISSFGGVHFHKLSNLLALFRIRKVVVLFDNEVKDDPRFESYKPDPLKRWDTDYWAIRMAKRLFFEEGIESALIARLPNEWRDKARGKIDPDGALALGYTAEDLRQVVEGAIIPNRYLENLARKEIRGEEARKVLTWKLAKDKWWNQNPKEEGHCYKWVVESEGGAVKTTISNFTLRGTYTLIRAGADKTRERQYEATTAQGESFPVQLSPRQLASNQQFTESLLQQGDLNWTGKADHLNKLRQRLLDLAPPLLAEEAEFFGHNEVFKHFMFGDGALTTSGGVFPVGDYGVIWQELKGLVPLQDKQSPIPKMGLDAFDPAKPLPPPPSPVEMYEALRDAYGFPGAALAGGWSLSCVFSDFIFDLYHFFPLLALIGPKEGGKSTKADLIVRQWGFASNGSAAHRIDWRQSTPKGLQRTFAKYRSLPVFIDEYRNDAHPALIATLRALFDRSAGVQAEFSNDGRTKTTSVRGCGIFAGEEVPADPALLSRCIHLEIDRNRRNKAHFERCKKVMEEGIALVRWTILNSQRLWPKIRKAINESREGFTEVIEAGGVGARIAEAYAVPFAVWATIAEEIDGERAESAKEELAEWICHELPEIQEERTEDDHLGRFFQALARLAQEPEPGGARRTEGDTTIPVSMRINSQHVILGRKRRSLYLNLNDAYAVYAKMEKTPPFTVATLRKYLKHAPYAKAGGSRKFGSHRISRRSWEIDLAHPACPEDAGSLEEILFAQLDEQDQTETRNESKDMITA
jgi:hypothetical protein